MTDLHEPAKQHAEKNITHPAEIAAGKIYSNGKLGKLCSIRHVVDMCLRGEFRQWARYEVKLKDNRWVKLADGIDK